MGTEQIAEPALNEFTMAYVMAALFTFEENPPQGEYSTSGRFQELFPLIDPRTLYKMIEDCTAFLAQADLTDYPQKQAGYDFWFTRNGHGVGFWEEDYGTPEQCQKLTALCKEFGEFDLYSGDGEDLKIYGSPL